MWNFPLFISAEKDMMLKLRGAYKEDCLIPGSEENPSCTQTIRYYINRDLETEFSLIPPKVCHWLNWWFLILINLSSMYISNRWECIMPVCVFGVYPGWGSGRDKSKDCRHCHQFLLNHYQPNSRLNSPCPLDRWVLAKSIRRHVFFLDPSNFETVHLYGTILILYAEIVHLSNPLGLL